jgi:tetratricopeptide (TPR) repeat protein
MNRPPLTVISLAIGAFLLPVLGGHPSVEQARISGAESFIVSLLSPGQMPLGTHFFVSLFFLVPLLHAFFTKKIIHVPAITITGSLALFIAAIGMSVFWSDFKHSSSIALIDWMLMAASYFAVTANAGRRQGLIVLYGYVIGVSLCAVLGLIEFRDMRQIDPGYRINAMQINPNQAGAMFVSGICVSIATLFTVDRVPKLLLGFGVALQIFALMLTQSKGAILCLPIGLVVLFVGILVLKPIKVGQAVAVAVLPIALGAVMTVGAQKAVQTPAGGGAAPLNRFSNSTEVANQSVGFRKLLWQTAIDLAKEKPHGYGIGTFWYESTRPGRVTQTSLAHQTYLQLAAEASFLAPLGLGVFFIMAIARSLRGSKNLPDKTKSTLLAAYSGIAVALAHNMIDSDMYVFGLGATMFMLAGIITASSADSQAPEFVFTLPRVAIGIGALLATPLSLSLSYAEYQRGVSRGAVAEKNGELAVASLNSAIGSTFADGQAHYLRGRLINEISDLESAASLHPSPKFYRTLADAYFANAKPKEGFAALSKALQRDPQNAPTLLRYVNMCKQQGDLEQADAMARRLISTEGTTYFQVRSIAELVPTQTFEARVYLAERTENPQEKVKLLSEALRGYVAYRNQTAPVVLRSLKADPNFDYGGENRDTVSEKMNKSLQIIAELRKTQRDVGLDLDAEASACEAILADLLK